MLIQAELMDMSRHICKLKPTSLAAFQVLQQCKAPRITFTTHATARNGLSSAAGRAGPKSHPWSWGPTIIQEPVHQVRVSMRLAPVV
eukprot:CAMPEP_0119112852 /NCGR_PEP_ID=MMETSP1180-20130426/41987_1 /TAXON_ID=3052 ORGANISM="Chlamydomonas cf sp, Strain CCMP681" /NCGR_SAMPLE_ID=MMETSP1180 /ASSEMBLY_ACC=CAM_ASM_000741 /LENGTH=86 /DNA_ID=CAMNT_0007100597 /DNA_START=2312 /DNA_END=2572 /DNA_ORIENTATION=+